MAKKIALVGAGSVSFGLSTLVDLMLAADELRGCTVSLADVDSEALELMQALAERMAGQVGAQLRIEGSTDLQAAVRGSDFVVVSVARSRLPTWQKDWEIPRRHGVRQVLGENGGPGGLGHTLRSVHLVCEVGRQIEAAAPDALVLNFTNPLTRVCMGLARATRLRVIGLCHGIGHAYRAAGEVLGIVAEGDHSRAAYELIERKVDIKAAGLNHNTFVYAMRDAETGEDRYPEFLRRLREMPASYRPLARRMTDAFGLFPSLEDGHTGEYYAWAWETSPEQGYDFARAAEHAAERRAWLQRAAAGQEPLDDLLAEPSGERAIPIIAACVHARNQYEVALNIPNRGSIAGLPDWAIVELPGVVGPAGVYGLQVPELPPAITAALAQQVAIQERAVTAALTGDRQAALQSLLLDPTVWSYGAATAILDELLEAHAPFLPQFQR